MKDTYYKEAKEEFLLRRGIKGKKSLERYFWITDFNDIPLYLLDDYFKSERHKRTLENIKMDLETRRKYASKRGGKK